MHNDRRVSVVSLTDASPTCDRSPKGVSTPSAQERAIAIGPKSSKSNMHLPCGDEAAGFGHPHRAVLTIRSLYGKRGCAPAAQIRGSTN